jgi:hypothetical protein
VTVQVADGTGRFCKNLKFSGSLGHGLILTIRVKRFNGLNLIRICYFRKKYRGINGGGQGARKQGD